MRSTSNLTVKQTQINKLRNHIENIYTSKLLTNLKDKLIDFMYKNRLHTYAQYVQMCKYDGKALDEPLLTPEELLQQKKQLTYEEINQIKKNSYQQALYQNKLIELTRITYKKRLKQNEERIYKVQKTKKIFKKQYETAQQRERKNKFEKIKKAQEKNYKKSKLELLLSKKLYKTLIKEQIDETIKVIQEWKDEFEQNQNL